MVLLIINPTVNATVPTLTIPHTTMLWCTSVPLYVRQQQ